VKTAVRVARIAGRFICLWLVEAVALIIVSWMIPEVELVPSAWPEVFLTALWVALVLAVANGALRPLIIWVARPINVLTFGLSTLFISAFVLVLAAELSEALAMRDIWWGLLYVVVLSVVNGLLMSLLGLEDGAGFWNGVARWQARRAGRAEEEEWPGRGVVLLEIDGLSHTMMRRAIDRGFMPTVAGMMADGSHTLSPYDCGLPSQTSSCQAGIMYGDNWDIPAFRWFDKATGKVVSSSDFDDAAAMDRAHRTGEGLLRGGAGINNHARGDAARLLFVLSAIKERDPARRREAARDLNRFFLDPYLFPRAFVLSLVDVLREVVQAVVQRVRDVRPRIERLRGPYPLVRGATNVLLRNLSTFSVVNEVVRGAPGIYTTYIGYDEVAHHAGPATDDALRTLKGLDGQIARVLQATRRWAGRGYDVFVLSDHGQSWGATFSQRYGASLAELFERAVGALRKVSTVDGTEHASGQTRAFLTELQDARRMGRAADREDSGADERTAAKEGARGGMVARSAEALRKPLDRAEPGLEGRDPVVVCASGNLANVYFDISDERATLEELEAAYPGLVGKAAEHEGVGFVIVLSDDAAAAGPGAGDGAVEVGAGGGRHGGGVAGGQTAWMIGARGRRNLIDGTVEGEDPLAAFAAGEKELEKRAAQLTRLAAFPHSGDLIIGSTLYEDGTVAAFEELVGNHGGLGGLQTEAFILHPADMEMPETSNATDIFPLVDARRGVVA